MAAVNEHYDAPFKQRVLEEYKPGVRGCGFEALAARFKVKNAQSISDWHRVWDGSVESLERKKGSGRKRKLTDKESKAHIKDFVDNANREGKVVTYADVHTEVKEKTGKDVSLSTVRRIGRKDHGLSFKSTTRKYDIEGRL